MKNTAFSAVTPAFLAVLLSSTAALAVDFTIPSPDTVTTTQALAGAGDTLTVEAGASVSTTGTSVQFNAANQALTNHGIVVTTHGNALAVTSAATNTLITNHGRISTVSDDGFSAMIEGLNTKIVNYGTLESSGMCSYGIFAKVGGFELENHGTISTSSTASSWGIKLGWTDETGPTNIYHAADNARIRNFGTITTNAPSGNAFYIHGSNTVIDNAGLIETHGNDSMGIYVFDYASKPGAAQITNSGTIRTHGATNSQPVYINARSSHLINSGTIAAAHGDAIYLGSTNQQLTLKRGTRIEGSIGIKDPNSATLNVENGLNLRLKMNARPGVVNANGQAVGYDPNAQILTVMSADIFDGVTTSSGGTMGAVNATLLGRMTGLRHANPASSAPLGYAPVNQPFFPDFSPSDDSGLWARGFGEITAPRPDHEGTRATTGGGMIGFDTQLDTGIAAGLYAGYSFGKAELIGGASLETSTFVTGSYLSTDLGAYFVDVNAALGGTFNHSSRTVMNSALATLETATADFNGVFFSPSVTLGFDRDLGLARLTPTLTLGYSGNYHAAYSETGTSDNLSLDNRLSHVLNARAAVELGDIALGGADSSWNGSFMLGADGSIALGRNGKANLSGSTFDLDAGTLASARGFAGAELSYQHNGFGFTAATEIGYSTTGQISARFNTGLSASF